MNTLFIQYELLNRKGRAINIAFTYEHIIDTVLLHRRKGISTKGKKVVCRSYDNSVYPNKLISTKVIINNLLK